MAKKHKQDPYLFEPLAQAAYHFRKTWDAHGDSPRGFVSNEPSFRLTDFIPRETGQFYTYRGSLTWPPCFGYVVWSVYQLPLYMSKRQFDQFAQIPAETITDTGLFAENRRTFSQIFVEQEEDPNLDYNVRKEFQDKRTLHRLIVAGTHHEGVEGEKQEGIVDHEGYYVRP